MATSGMASSFVLTSNLAAGAVALPAARPNSVTFFRPNKRFALRAEEPEGEIAPVEEEVAADEPEGSTPVAFKKGTKVKILRKESYWYNGIGSVVVVDKDPKSRYPVSVRFKKVNYAGIFTNSYAMDELQLVE